MAHMISRPTRVPEWALALLVILMLAGLLLLLWFDDEAQRLTRLLGECRELGDRALREPGERGRRPHLAREPGGARRCLRSERKTLEHGHASAALREVVGHARAERAGANDHGVRRVDHPGSLSPFRAWPLARLPGG